MLLIGLVACGTTTGVDVSAIDFEPNPATFVAGVCESAALLIPLHSNPVTLVSLQATFRDEAGARATFEVNGGALDALGDSSVVPAFGAATLNLDFDLGEQGLVAPASGTIVVIGTGLDGTTQFVGQLNCETP